MPTPAEILADLRATTNDWTALAVAWHAYLALLVVALSAGRRPSRRVFGILLALPTASVAALAWAAGNPFTGTLVGALFLVLTLLALRLPAGSVTVGPRPLLASGGLLLALGWVYPEFLEAGSAWAYLVAAPTGLLPCPTLLAVTGLALSLDGLEARAWPSALAVGGLIYGLLGVFALGVRLDGLLVLGALTLLAVAWRRRPGRPPAAAPAEAGAQR